MYKNFSFQKSILLKWLIFKLNNISIYKNLVNVKYIFQTCNFLYIYFYYILYIVVRFCRRRRSPKSKKKFQMYVCCRPSNYHHQRKKKRFRWFTHFTVRRPSNYCLTSNKEEKKRFQRLHILLQYVVRATLIKEEEKTFQKIHIFFISLSLSSTVVVRSVIIRASFTTFFIFNSVHTKKLLFVCHDEILSLEFHESLVGDVLQFCFCFAWIVEFFSTWLRPSSIHMCVYKCIGNGTVFVWLFIFSSGSSTLQKWKEKYFAHTSTIKKTHWYIKYYRYTDNCSINFFKFLLSKIIIIFFKKQWQQK